MKKLYFLIISNFVLLLTTFSLFAQNSAISYKLYGFVRAEGYYNDRRNVDVLDGTNLMYPKDAVYDSKGHDLNHFEENGFYSYNTRLGLDFKGPDILSAKLTAKIEGDFAGGPGITSVLRIRHGYLKLTWDKGSSLLLGQTWHPFWGDFFPQVQDLSAGAPFQFLNRSPMIQYSYRKNRIRLQGSAIYESQQRSYGPSTGDAEYMKTEAPELVLGIEYLTNDFRVGGNVEFLSLRPRMQSQLVPNGSIFKVNETVNSFSYEIHSKYVKKLFQVAGKTALASNMSHALTLGGYGVHSEDPLTGERSYTTFMHSISWLNVAYGEKYKVTLFGGYIKNLGSAKSILNPNLIYGRGTDIDQLTRWSVSGSYNLPNWQIGVEYNLSTARYGTANLSSGKIENLHPTVVANRLSCVIAFIF